MTNRGQGRGGERGGGEQTHQRQKYFRYFTCSTPYLPFPPSPPLPPSLPFRSLHKNINVCTRDYSMIYRGPGFLAIAMVWLHLQYPPSSSPLRKLGRKHTGRLRKRDNLLTGKGRRGEEPNHTTARKPGPL
jgi:hypothetical protein